MAAEIVKQGPLSYRLYSTPRGTWKAYIRWGGKAWWAQKKTRVDALSAITEHANRANLGEVLTKISSKDAVLLFRASKLLEPYGVTIEDAARYYAAAHAGIERRITAQEAVDEFLALKIADGLSARYVENIRFFTRPFSAKFGTTSLGEITPVMLDDWLRALGFRARSRNNGRSMLITLFRWARDRGYLPYGQPLAPERLTLARNEPVPIAVISPRRLAALLRRARWKGKERPHAETCLMFAAHTGIRLAELARLQWEAVDVESGHIEIGADIAKTASRRLISITPALSAWLSTHRKESGPVIPSMRVYSQMTSLWPEKPERKGRVRWRGREGWPQNCLRHSFISYRVAETGDVAKVALEAGNSPQKIFSNYRSIKLPDGRLITKALAAQWFSVGTPAITPPATGG